MRVEGFAVLPGDVVHPGVQLALQTLPVVPRLRARDVDDPQFLLQGGLAPETPLLSRTSKPGSLGPKPETLNPKH